MKIKKANKSSFQKDKKLIKSEIVRIAVVPVNMLVKPKEIIAWQI